MDQPSGIDEKPRIGFIGAGRVARTLAAAWADAGERVAGVYSRSARSAQIVCAEVAACTAHESAQALADHVDLAFVTVPDDAIRGAVEGVRWRPGQAVVHCSGASDIALLDDARRQGAAIGGFHPLQIFSDPRVARDHLAGSYVAVEAGPPLHETLHRLAAVIGCRPFALPHGARVMYHVAANYAGSFLLSLLHEAEELWSGCGLAREDALPALMPLVLGTIDSARHAGLARALAGPVSRGDIDMLQRHLAALEQDAPSAVALYAELTARAVELARCAGRQPAPLLAEMARLVACLRP